VPPALSDAGGGRRVACHLYGKEVRHADPIA
jgi:hypothetical protein